jgi:hypothetical protein
MRSHCLVVALVVIASPRIAGAQYNVPSQASGQSGKLEIAGDDPAKPSAPALAIGWEIGASLDFMTSDPSGRTVEPSLAERKLKFTDVVLFRAHGLLALGRRTELFAGVDLLPKQPSYTDELVWQSALLGARYRFSDPWSAYVRGQSGPGLARDGYWLAGEAALQYRLDLAEKTLFWESALGATYTQLFPDEPVDKLFWQTELLAQSGIAVREKRGIFAAWLTFAFQFPLVARPAPGSPDPASDRALDPQTRVGVAFGMVLGISRSVDLFTEISVLDRGDVDDARTTLPILGGGFDQNRIVFGFNRRFGPRRRSHD